MGSVFSILDLITSDGVPPAISVVAPNPAYLDNRNVFIGKSKALIAVSGDIYTPHTRGDTAHGTSKIEVNEEFNVFVGPNLKVPSTETTDSIVGGSCSIPSITFSEDPIPPHNIFIGN